MNEDQSLKSYSPPQAPASASIAGTRPLSFMSPNLLILNWSLYTRPGRLTAATNGVFTPVTGWSLCGGFASWVVFYNRIHLCPFLFSHSLSLSHSHFSFNLKRSALLTSHRILLNHHRKKQSTIQSLIELIGTLLWNGQCPSCVLTLNFPQTRIFPSISSHQNLASPS